MGKKKEEKLPPEAEEAAAASEDNSEDETAVDAAADGAAEDAGEDFQAEAARNKELYLRALADLENYRKRAQREKEDAIRFANSNLLREMIPVIDNLERAVEHASENGDQDQGLLEGVQMTLEQFRKVLEGFGVKVLESLGQQFDPEFHQAMGEMVSSDCEPGSVAQEMQKAYTLNGRLLRPALVM
ncbi:MAG: nucleotide exchange factor GrpE, partial [Desulfuromonadales bacterium]|nr:nucleotide exchange factor GrpE [Desulfuromonadales bacterium]NIS39434.1 nucleotide exchange factor GrpE [Desulfuromonadales bacterium]